MDQPTGVTLFVSNGEGKKTPTLKDRLLQEGLFIITKEKLKYKIFYKDIDEASKDNRIIEQFAGGRRNYPWRRNYIDRRESLRPNKMNTRPLILQFQKT